VVVPAATPGAASRPAPRSRRMRSRCSCWALHWVWPSSITAQ